MKKLSAILLFAGILAACDDTASTDEILGLDAATEVKLPFDDLTESKTISFTAPDVWEAKIADKTRAESWLSVKPASGQSGKNTVTVTTTSVNGAADSRSATVTITSGGSSKTFTVTQHSESSQREEENGGGNTGKYYVDAVEPSYTFSSAAQTVPVSVKSNFDFSIRETYGSGDQGGWLTTNISASGSGNGTYSVSLNLQANTGAERTATLSFEDSTGKSYATTIVTQSAGGQEPGVTPELRLEYSGVNIRHGAADTTIYFKVYSNVPFIATETWECDWARVLNDYQWTSNSATEGTRVGVYVASANSTAGERNMSVSVIADGSDDKKYFTITQAAAGKDGGSGGETKLITYSGGSLEFTVNGGAQSVTFSVSDQITSVTCSSSSDWMMVLTPQRVNGNVYSVTVECSPGAGRKGWFTIKATGGGKEESVDVTVSQGT